MFRATIKSILGHKFRLITTGFAVVLGIMFLAGASVLADTVGATFDKLAGDITGGTDAVVRGRQVLGDAGDPQGFRPRVPADLVATVQRVEGVAAAEGAITGYAQLIGKDGKAIGGGGPPTFGGNWGEVDELNPYDVAEGRVPAADDEVIIDRSLSKRGDLALGDATKVLTRAGAIPVKVVGIASFRGLDSAGGATFIGFTTPAAQQLIGQPGMFDTIAVVAGSGVTESQVRDRLAAAVPSQYEAATGTELKEESQDDFAALVNGFRTVLSVFAYIALFVGSFIIYNTFQIIVAQRTREMALLRALGATRRQVLVSILLEAVAVGVVASMLGFVAGIGMAAVIKALMAAFGFDLPAEGLVIRPSAAVLALIVGTLTTLVAAVFPAWRAARVAPIAAMRDVAFEQKDRTRSRTVIGVVATGLGMLLLVTALAQKGDGALARIGLGAALTLIGVIILGPVFARPMSRLLGAPLPRVRGATGNLARENAMRNPKRTARTAAALMIGVALVSAITVVASSIQKSFDEVIGEQFRGDFVVSAGAPFGGVGVSVEVGRALQEKRELAAVMPIRGTQVDFDYGEGRKGTFLSAVDSAASNKIANLSVAEGDLATLGADGIAVHDEWAADHGVTLNEPVSITFVDTGKQAFVVRAIYENKDLAGDFFVDLPAFDANVRDQFDQQILIKSAEGVAAGQVRAAIESVTVPYPNVDVLDRDEFLGSQGDFIQGAVYFVYGMLALAVIIALFGIANTMSLSIVERTRELGLLRAVGMTRGQLRSTVRWEAALMSLFGIVGGVAVGVFFGWALMQGFQEQGLRAFDLPVIRLVVIALVVLGLAVLSAVVPAWRAGRLDVLRAIGHE